VGRRDRDAAQQDGGVVWRDRDATRRRRQRWVGEGRTILVLQQQRILVHWSPTTTDADRPLRHALEVRHASFKTAEFVQLLRDNDIALVCADTAGKWPALDDVTSDFVYARLHGDQELYTSGYDDANSLGFAIAIDVFFSTKFCWFDANPAGAAKAVNQFYSHQ